VTYSADGRALVAVGGGERSNGRTYGQLLIWDAVTLERKTNIDDLPQNLWSVAISPDSRQLAVGGGGLGPRGPGILTMYRLSTKTGALEASWPKDPREQRPSRVFALAYSPDSSLLAVGSESTTVSLLDGRGFIKHEFKTPGLPPLMVRGLAFGKRGPRETLLASAAGVLAKGDTGYVTIWRLEDHREVMREGGKTGEHADEVSAVAILDGGHRLATGSLDRTVKIWDIDRRRVTLTMRRHTDHVRALAVSPDGRMLVSAGEDGRAVVWDASEPPPVERCQVIRTDFGRIWDAQVGRDGKTLAAIGEKRTNDGVLRHVVQRWDLSRPEAPVELAEHQEEVRGLALAPADAGGWVGGPTLDGCIPLLNPTDDATGRPLSAPEAQTAWRASLAVSPDGKLVAANHDYDIELWDVEKGQSKLLGSHRWVVGSLAFSPIASVPLLASGSWDQTARLWNYLTLTGEPPLKGHRGRVNAVAFDAQAKWLATASNDATVGIWDVATRKLQRPLIGHTDIVLGVAFSPVAPLVASVSRDQTIRLWAPDSGALLGTLRGPRPRLRNVSFTPDGKLVIASGDDKPGSGQIELCPASAR
jgi:WD40 repeat protein